MLSAKQILCPIFDKNYNKKLFAFAAHPTQSLTLVGVKPWRHKIVVSETTHRSYHPFDRQLPSSSSLCLCTKTKRAKLKLTSSMALKRSLSRLIFWISFRLRALTNTFSVAFLGEKARGAEGVWRRRTRVLLHGAASRLEASRTICCWRDDSSVGGYSAARVRPAYHWPNWLSLCTREEPRSVSQSGAATCSGVYKGWNLKINIT